MMVYKEDLVKVKEPENFIYDVYRVYSKAYYTGTALVAAVSEDHLKEIIRVFKVSDKDNKRDSRGWGDWDLTEMVADEPGIFENGIYYYGS